MTSRTSPFRKVNRQEVMFKRPSMGFLVEIFVFLQDKWLKPRIVCNNSVEDEKVRSFGVGLAQGCLG